MTQPQYFLGLNGPPRSGKDTLAQGLYNHFWVRDRFLVQSVKYAKPLKDAVHTLFGGEYSEEAKDELSPYGPSWRELYIGMSEIYAKRLCGPEIFGQIMVERMKVGMASSRKPTLWLCTDCGFEKEQAPVIRHLGAENFKLIHVHREGHDFSKDSRSYISPEGIQTLAYYNHQPTVAEAHAEFNFIMLQTLVDWGWTQDVGAAP